MSLSMTASTAPPATDAPVTVRALLVDANKTPVAGQPVRFQILGSSSITLDSTVVTTDSSGVAYATVAHTGSGPFVVGALADDFAANADIAIRAILPISRSVAPASPVPTTTSSARHEPPPTVPSGPAGPRPSRPVTPWSASLTGGAPSLAIRAASGMARAGDRPWRLGPIPLSPPPGTEAGARRR